MRRTPRKTITVLVTFVLVIGGAIAFAHGGVSGQPRRR